jgi:hypothetical protein
LPTRIAWTPAQLALFDADQKRRRKRNVPAPERSTHIAVADMLWKLARPGWYWTHIPSGELRTEATGRLLKRMGLKPGIPDFLFIAPNGTHHWLELKRGYAKLTEPQSDFRDMCIAQRIPHAVARSFAEAEAQLRDWGVLRPEARP